MKGQLEKRLNQLKSEYESGQKMLAELEVKQADLRKTLLRISGAIQVLEEELAKVSQPSPDDSAFPQDKEMIESSLNDVTDQEAN